MAPMSFSARILLETSKSKRVDALRYDITVTMTSKISKERSVELEVVILSHSRADGNLAAKLSTLCPQLVHILKHLGLILLPADCGDGIAGTAIAGQSHTCVLIHWLNRSYDHILWWD